MAINLLPSEQKIKFKKQKSVSELSSIEMTGPKKVAKKKPGIKSAGVLEFFKHPFQRPKKETARIEREGITKLPEKKVILKEKIIIQRPKETIRPKVEFRPQKTKPESLRVKPSFNVWQKLTGIFSRPVKQKVEALPEALPKEERKPFVPQEQFPKYKTVKAEKILPKPITKPRQAVVVKLNSKSMVKEGKKPAKKGLSVWQRFKLWLKNIFSPGLKQIPKHPPVEKEVILPMKLPAKPPIVFEREQVIKFKPKEKPEILKPAQKPAVKPSPLVSKPAPEVPAAPSPPLEIELDKKSVDQEIKELYTPDKISRAPSFVRPEVPVKEKIIHEVVKEEKAVPPPPLHPIKKRPPKKKGVGLFKAAAGLFSRFWQSIKELFGKEKKMPAPLAVREERPVQKEEKITTEGKPAIAELGIKEKPTPIKAEEKAHFTIPSPFPSKGKEPEKREAPSFAPPPPLPEEANKEAPPPQPSKSEPAKMESGFKLTQPTTPIIPPDEMEWEVNLIPEEAIVKEISISKILYLVMSLTIAMAMVFGGWLWADYYYNTITKTIHEIDAEIASKNGEISKFQRVQREVQNLKNNIDNVQELLDQHIYWSEIFNKIERYTIPEVYYKSMVADVNGSVSLEAVGKDYESALRQLFVLERASDFVSDVTISTIGFAKSPSATTTTSTPATVTTVEEVKQDEKVKFTLTLSVLPNIFYYPR